MSSKGYCLTSDVATYMGRTFTADQDSMADLMIGTAESWIDDQVKHAWLETSPITDVIYDPQRAYIHLAKPPITAVNSLKITVVPTGIEYTLTVDSEYFVHDLQNGIIYSPYTLRVYKATVEYVPNSDAVPDAIQAATRVLAASYMRMAPGFLEGVDPNLIQRYQIGGELQVEFRKNLWAGVVVPQLVLTLLDTWLKNYSLV